MNNQLATIAGQIRALEKDIISNVIETGRLIDEANQLCQHGEYLDWLKAEFQWTHRTAHRYRSVWKLSNKIELKGLDLSLSALYVMCDLHRSTKRSKRDSLSEIIETAKTKRVTKKIAEHIVVSNFKPPQHYGGPLLPYLPERENMSPTLHRLAAAVEDEKIDWDRAVKYIKQEDLRAIIDKLEALYAARAKPKLELVA
jgi:hypothetical protein